MMRNKKIQQEQGMNHHIHGGPDLDVFKDAKTFELLFYRVRTRIQKQISRTFPGLRLIFQGL